MCQKFLNDRILNFEPDMMLTRIFRVFILFGTVTSGGKKLRVVSKVTLYYIIIAVDLLITLPNWFTLLQEFDGFEKFKMKTCSA